MKMKIRLTAAVITVVTSVSLQAHEGHAVMGTMAHEIEHAGWITAALMLGSVMILWVFSLAAKLADKRVCTRD